MRKKIIFFFCFLLATAGYAGQEIGNGTIEVLLTLPQFQNVLTALKGEYVLDEDYNYILFSVSRTGKIKIKETPYSLGKKIKGKISAIDLKPDYAVVTFTFEIETKIKTFEYELGL